MSKLLANILSVVLHPLLMPSILFSIIYLTSPFVLTPYDQPNFLIIIFITSFLIPLIGVIALYKLGAFKSFVMDDKGERGIPFAFTAIFYWLITYLFFRQFNNNTLVITIILGISITISLVAIVNFFYKISAHTAGILGIIGALFALSIKYPEVQFIYPILALIVVSGFVMSARLFLQVHSIQEILVGGILGLAVNFVFLLVLM